MNPIPMTFIRNSMINIAAKTGSEYICRSILHLLAYYSPFLSLISYIINVIVLAKIIMVINVSKNGCSYIYTIYNLILFFSPKSQRDFSENLKFFPWTKKFGGFIFFFSAILYYSNTLTALCIFAILISF